MLDAARFPHIVDIIFAHASRPALLALRLASKDFCSRADALFLRRVIVTSATNPWSDPEFWEYAISTPLGRPPLLRAWHDDMGRYVAHLGLWVDRAARRAEERAAVGRRLPRGWAGALGSVRVLELVGTIGPDGVGEFTSSLSGLEVVIFTAAGEEDAADVAPFAYADAPTSVIRSGVDCGSNPTIPLPEVGDDNAFPERMVLVLECTPRECWRYGVTAMLGIPLGTRELVIVCKRAGVGEEVDEGDVGPLGLLTDLAEVVVQHLPHMEVTLVDLANAFPSFRYGEKSEVYERRARAELYRLVGAAERNAKIDAAFPSWTETDAHAAVDTARFLSLEEYRTSIGERRWEHEMA